MPDILHLSSDYSRQALYRRLFEDLSSYFCQNVLVPVRTDWELQMYPSELYQLKIIKILKPWDKLFFTNKVRKIVGQVPREFLGSGLTHAHFLYTDGAVALEIKKNYGIPYVVSVRNADINYFSKLRPDLYTLREEIILNAEKIIFLNKPFYQKLYAESTEVCKRKLENSAVFIPNGLSNKWFTTKIVTTKNTDRPIILYVGDLSKNKNIKHIIDSVDKLNQMTQYKSRLQIVGEGGCSAKDLEYYKNHQLVDFKGRVTSFEQLASIYQEATVFCMPSHRETFGIVYIEALSQGTPIIHTKDQGIDGWIENSRIALPVTGTDIIETAKCMKYLIQNGDGAECINVAKQCFSMFNVVQEHKRVYEEIVH